MTDLKAYSATDRVHSCDISIKVDGEETAISVSGYSKDITVVAQQLTWLTACFRLPEKDQLSISDVVFKQVTSHLFTIHLDKLKPINEAEKLCWHTMFANSVIARGFPIPPRGAEKGVELPFELMTTLASTWYSIDTNDGIVLRGYSGALLPISRDEDRIQWHYHLNVDPKKRISIDDISAASKHILKDTDIVAISKQRTFLGFCRKANIHLGTRGSGYENVLASEVAPEPIRPVVAREINISLGTSGKGIFGAMLSFPIHLPASVQALLEYAEQNLLSQIQSSQDKATILYDVAANRGWLVPELSALLHLIHAWSSKQIDRADISGKIPHAEISCLGNEAVLNVIKNHKSDGPVRKAFANEKALYFMDCVKFMWMALECRKEAARARQRNFMGLGHQDTTLLGWDVKDILDENRYSERRKVRLQPPSVGCSWGCISHKNLDVTVLFGRGFGEPIKPDEECRDALCAYWTPNASHHDCLIANVPCIHNLTSSIRSQTTYPMLSPGLFCERRDEVRLFEDCKIGSSFCNRFHVLRHQQNKEFDLISEGRHGAIIFAGKVEVNSQTCHAQQQLDLPLLLPPDLSTFLATNENESQITSIISSLR
jgi:hypothetical protein